MCLHFIENKTLYGALTRWGYLNTHIIQHMIHTVDRKMQYDRKSLIEIAVYIVAEIAVYRTNRLKINML